MTDPIHIPIHITALEQVSGVFMQRSMQAHFTLTHDIARQIVALALADVCHPLNDHEKRIAALEQWAAQMPPVGQVLPTYGTPQDVKALQVAAERAKVARLSEAVNANDEVQQGLRDEITALKQSHELILADADKRRDRLAAELRLAGEQLHAAKSEVKWLEKLLGVTGREGQA